MPSVRVHRRTGEAHQVEARVVRFDLGDGTLLTAHDPHTLPSGRLEVLPGGEVDVGDKLDLLLRLPVVASVVTVSPDGRQVEVQVRGADLPFIRRGRDHFPQLPEPLAD